jgi:hypothetical protein
MSRSMLCGSMPLHTALDVGELLAYSTMAFATRWTVSGGCSVIGSQDVLASVGDACSAQCSTSLIDLRLHCRRLSIDILLSCQLTTGVD